MNWSLFRTRISKAATSVAHPACWKALSLGVAPAIEHLPVLRRLDIDGIIDVGANRGQFSLACRIAIPHVPILAFEPIPGEADRFEKIHCRNGVVLYRCALGESHSTAVLHLSQSPDSSSLLPIGKRQVEAYPQTAEAGTISVDLKPLDSFGQETAGRDRQLLKIDVQGYELKVLQGAVEMLKSCKYVYVECSEVPLYDGQALRPEVELFLKNQGFHHSESFNHCFFKGELIQADYLLTRV